MLDYVGRKKLERERKKKENQRLVVWVNLLKESPREDGYGLYS
jgi:glycine cleavage system aminomethyltransferase T